MQARWIGALAVVAVLGSAPGAALELPANWSAEGRVQTVTGLVAPDKLGFTLPHEHLFVDFLKPLGSGTGRLAPLSAEGARVIQQFGYLPIPESASEIAFWNRNDLSLDMINDLRLAHLLGDGGISNMGPMNHQVPVLEEYGDALGELRAYAAAGGGAVVDQTVVGIGRSPEQLLRVASESGVHVIMGAGWYRWPYHPTDLMDLEVDDLAQRLVDDVTVGVGNTSIRSGIIGEIPLDPSSVAVNLPMGEQLAVEELNRRMSEQRAAADSPDARAEEVYHPAEIRVLRAAARAARATGAPLSLHALDLSGSYLDIVAEEGLDLGRVMISHSDRVMLDREVRNRFFARGVTLMVDFGLQYFPTIGPVGPHELLLDAIAAAVLEGHVDQMMLSLDICLKLGRKKYGGSGLTGLHDIIIPALVRRGVTPDHIRTIMVANPAKLLTFAAPQRL